MRSIRVGILSILALAILTHGATAKEIRLQCLGPQRGTPRFEADVRFDLSTEMASVRGGFFHGIHQGIVWGQDGDKVGLLFPEGTIPGAEGKEFMMVLEIDRVNLTFSVSRWKSETREYVNKIVRWGDCELVRAQF